MTHDFNVLTSVQPHQDDLHCGACRWSHDQRGAYCELFSRYSLAEMDASQDNLRQYMETAKREYDTSTHITGPGGRLLDPWLRCPACLAAQKENQP